MALSSYNGFSGEQRDKAQRWLNEQWASGRLARPCKCVACGQTAGVIDAHAEDYSEPFAAGKTDEFHLCYLCHLVLHCRRQNRAMWLRYRKDIASGIIFAPFYSRSWPRFQNMMLKGYHAAIMVTGEPHADVLGRIVGEAA